jgi:hypothetical protein
MLYEVMLKNALSAAVIQMVVMNMATYTEGSFIYELSLMVSCSDVFFSIGGAQWTIYVMLICLIVWTIYLFKAGANRLDYEALYY